MRQNINHENNFPEGLACIALSFVAVEDIFAGEGKYEQPNYLNSIKITFLSWTSGSTKVSYERAFPDWHQSGEICTSLISAGYDKYKNEPLGFTVRYGHKFFVGKNDISLKGFYLRPEFIWSYYHYNCTGTVSSPVRGRQQLWEPCLEQWATSTYTRNFLRISG